MRPRAGRLGADDPYVPLLLTVPGVGPLLAYTIAGEIGEIERFASPKKLTLDTGLCRLVRQSGNRDVRGIGQEWAQVPALGAHRGGNPRP